MQYVWGHGPIGIRHWYETIAIDACPAFKCLSGLSETLWTLLAQSVVDHFTSGTRSPKAIGCVNPIRALAGDPKIHAKVDHSTFDCETFISDRFEPKTRIKPS
jgi:hypothetical protein